MSVEDLRAAYPNAIEIDHEPTRRGGTSDYWQVNDVRIADEKFTASFYFREHRLDSVILRPQSREPHKMAAIAETLRAALMQKYGQIAGQSQSKGEFIRGSRVSWITDGTTVSLETIEGSSGPISLQVRYDSRISNAASNL